MSEQEEKRSSWDPGEHLQIDMGVFMPEGVVPEDARRIAVRGLLDKDHVTQGVASRQIIGYEIRRRAEELIKTIYEQMDRQENANG